MNRAQRRFEARLQRPSGSFTGEFRRRADQRAYQEALRDQMTREANGEPVHPLIAQRMTKPKELQPLFQVGVTERETKQVVFLGPMMVEDACREICEQVNRQIAKGQRSDWLAAEAYPMSPITQGVN